MTLAVRMDTNYIKQYSVTLLYSVIHLILESCTKLPCLSSRDVCVQVFCYNYSYLVTRHVLSHGLPDLYDILLEICHCGFSIGSSGALILESRKPLICHLPDSCKHFLSKCTISWVVTLVGIRTGVMITVLCQLVINGYCLLRNGASIILSAFLLPFDPAFLAADCFLSLPLDVLFKELCISFPLAAFAWFITVDDRISGHQMCSSGTFWLTHVQVGNNLPAKWVHIEEN